MLRQTLAVLAVAALAGCSSSNGPYGSTNPPEPQLAAYAASSQFPSDTKPRTDMHIGALIDKNRDIKIANFTDKPLHDVKVWVNGNLRLQVGRDPGQQHGHAQTRLVLRFLRPQALRSADRRAERPTPDGQRPVQRAGPRLGITPPTHAANHNP